MARALGNNGLVQDELKPTEMPNTVAAPIDTFQRSSGNGAVSQFLKGLGELAGPVTTAFKDFDKEAGDEAEAQANMKALQAKPEDLRKEIESGNFYGMAHKRAQNAMHVMDAQNRVYEVSAQLDAMNHKGELAGADADGLIHGLVQSHADAVNTTGNTLAMKAFTNGMVPVMRQYGTAIMRQNIAQEQGDKEAKLFQYMTNLHDQVDRDAKGGGALAGNNPGNIEFGSFAKAQGSTSARAGGRFASFNTPADGYRAANALLDSYAKKGTVTPAQIIAKWAPADDDNDPETYTATVAKAAGLDLNAPLPNDPKARAKMLVAMTSVEHGKAPYNADTVAGWLKGGNEGNPTGVALVGDDLAAAHKRALFRTADFAKNDLLLSQDQIEKVLGKVAQHYAANGNMAAVDAVGAYDRNGTPLSAKYGPQWDVWKAAAKAKADETAKKAVADNVDGLEARALDGTNKPADFYKDVDAARAKDPENFGEARAQRLKDTFNARVEARQRQATAQLAAQQEASAGREFVEQGANALIAGHGYQLPSEGRFTAADGKERVYKRKDYEERMYARAEDIIDEQAKVMAESGWSPEQTATAKIRLYGQNGAVAPIYQRSFDDLFAGSRAGVPAAPDQLKQRLGQLEFLRQADLNQFLNLAGQKDKQQQTWLAAYKAAREFGSDAERAYAIANQRVFNPAAQERVTAKELSDKAEEVVKKFAGAGVLAGPIARAKAVDALNIQIAAGVSEKDLVDKAAQSLTASHIVANGVPVHNSIPGVGDPRVVKEYLEDAAMYFKRDNPRVASLPFTVALADDPAKIGSYIAIRADTMERLSRKGITGEEVQDYVLQQRQRERKEKKRWNDWYQGQHEPKDPNAIELSGD